jgi:hypothetical protein
MDIKRIFLLPDDILWNIFSFDTRFVLRFNQHSHNHMLIFIDKIPKDDFRYAILQKRIIITKEYRRNSSHFLNQNQNQTNKIILKQHKNISSIIIYDKNDITDIEFSHYLYQTIQMYHYF